MSNKIKMRVSIPQDEEGMIGRECPQKSCEKYFKVKPGTGIKDNKIMICPYCQYLGTTDQYFTKEQVEYAKSLMLREASKYLHQELKKMERHSFKSKFIYVNFKVKPQAPIAIKHYIEKRLQENIICETCECEYAIYGIFSICPDCGQQNLFQVVSSNLDLIEKQVSLEKNLREKFGEEFQTDLEDMFFGITNKITEDACENAVTIFETFFKELNHRYQFKSNNPAKKFTGNIFQRLDGAKDWFLEQYSFDILSGSENNEIDNLYLLFNKRHLLTHNLGIIDEKYITRTGIRKDVLNHKIEVSVEEILLAISTIRKIVQSARVSFS